MYVDDLHVSFAGMNCAAMLAFALALVAIELFKHGRQILNDALQFQLPLDGSTDGSSGNTTRTHQVSLPDAELR